MLLYSTNLFQIRLVKSETFWQVPKKKQIDVRVRERVCVILLTIVQVR